MNKYAQDPQVIVLYLNIISVWQGYESMGKCLIDKILYMQKEFCRMCELLYGTKDVDECFECVYHKMFNDILKLNT